VRNFPMQANGAEMLRLACCRATELGVRVCAPVHDAVLIEAPVGGLEDAVAMTQQAMGDASACVLGGFRLRTEAKIVRWPDRYADARGRAMWDAVTEALADLGQSDSGDRGDLGHSSPGTWVTMAHPSSLLSSSYRSSS